MTATAEPTVITTAADVLTDQLHRLEQDRWHVAESLDNATDAVTFQTAQLQRLNDLIADIKATLTRLGQQ